MFTSVENQFITKYLPQADGDAVRAYLYGLYACQCAGEFDAETAAKLLRIPLEKFISIFEFWEECDLVRILSRSPLMLEYLPVNAAVGKPKSVRPEKYAAFNRELYKLLQRARKDFKPYEMQRILEFLENEPMEQQAFLLVAEYCVKKDGEKVSSAHMLNKAQKLCREHKYTYEQVEADLAAFNAREKELTKLYAILGIYRKPQESDYALLEKWAARGMENGAVVACAEALKKGSLATLDILIDELLEKEIRTEKAAREYLARREELTSVVYKVARKLGVKVQNPRPYAEEYAEKWLSRGYEEESLLAVASVGMKLSFGFAEMDAMLMQMYGAGIVDADSVKAYCSAREGQLKLLQKLQAVCGVIKKTVAALDMVAAWKSWNMPDALIMEAAKRSSGASAPLPYINKLLSEWKREGITDPEAIPEHKTTGKETAPRDFRTKADVNADARSARERWYALRRNAAVERADRARAAAGKDKDFSVAEHALMKGEIDLAKAEVFSPAALPQIRERIEQARRARAAALAKLGMTESDLSPKYACPKCSDTGFLPDGRMCDCYSPENPQ